MENHLSNTCTKNKQNEFYQNEKTWALKCFVNNESVDVMVDPEETLYDVLRDQLRLTGTKGACLEGECGSCTVLLEGKPVTSCLVLAPQVAGKTIVTIEGLNQEGKLHAVQQGFLECGAVQCGYCTPGLIMSAVSFLEKNTQPTREEIRQGLEGNLCRCTGYTKVIDAVEHAAKLLLTEKDTVSTPNSQEPHL